MISRGVRSRPTKSKLIHSVDSVRRAISSISTRTSLRLIVNLTSRPLHTIHIKPEAQLLRFDGVIATEDRRDAAFGVDADLQVVYHVEQLYRDELRRSVQGRFDELGPRECDPSVLREEEQPTRVRHLGVSANAPVETDHAVVRVVDPLDAAYESVVVITIKLVVDGVGCRVSALWPILAYVRQRRVLGYRFVDRRQLT
jgi:hypothetical protein